jgi:hypothetical protein
MKWYKLLCWNHAQERKAHEASLRQWLQQAHHDLEVDPDIIQAQEDLGTTLDLSNKRRNGKLLAKGCAHVSSGVLSRTMEQNSFFDSIKPRSLQTSITEIVDSAGATHTSQPQLESICQAFYSNLYSQRPTEAEHAPSQAWAFSEVSSCISPAMVDSLQRPLSLGELHRVLKDMAKGKSSGPDGLTTEIFQCMWPTFGEEYFNMLLTSITQGSLPPGVTERLIALLHKGGGRNTLNNWRSITLLNVSYKIFAKALQMRLQPILMELISPDQSAFLPMCYILNNIFLTQETISHAKQSNQPFLFLKLDFSKAYDKVDLSFMFQALQILGFLVPFISMVWLLFQNAAT